MKAYGCVIALVLGTGPALDVVATAEVADQTVVGSCEAGAKKIVYKRGGASTP